MALSRRSFVRSWRSPPGVRRVPPGTSSAASATLSATSPRVSPSERRVALGISISISASRMPVSSTMEIPGWERRPVSISRAKSTSSRSLRSPETAMRMTSWRRPSPREMTGGSISSGKTEMRWTAAVISWRARLRSKSGKSSAVTWAPPSEATASRRFTISKPRSSDSMGTMTDCSTSSGPAPRYWTSMTTVSRTKTGKTSCLILKMEMMPTARTTNMRRFAA